MKNSDTAPIIVFDVNETLLDITTLEPLFDRLFGDAAMLRQWFAELILYSQTVTLSGLNVSFGELAAGTLQMVGTNHDIIVSDRDIAELKEGLANMPAYPDVIPALERLTDAGIRLITLTNSASAPSPTPLEKAGIDHFFDRHFSVDTVQKFKPARETYQYVAQELGVETADLSMVACHLWDIVGAQAAGCAGAFVTRSHNNILPAKGMTAPDLVVRDLGELADRFIQ